VEEHVLLVEDDQAIRDITARGLENAGFKVMPEGGPPQPTADAKRLF
jgi:DNA-binding response OmpR family regulator